MLKLYLDYTVHLVKCAILDTVPNPIPKEINLKDLLAFAKIHTVENIIYLPLKKLDIKDDTMVSFEEFYNHAIINDATQQYYLEIITDAFEQNKIRHCVMKGPVIKKLYPSTDMRQSGDLDIFVDDSNTEKCRNIMEQIGFETELFDKSAAHDEYIADKTVVAELHRKLISNKCPWDNKCQEIADRLIKSDGYEYRYEMSKEDYYLYMIGHMAKHMKYSGIGIKMFLDVWIYLNAYENILDKELLERRLKECGLYEFERNCVKMCDYWFNGAETDGIIKKMAIYVGMSGNFGTDEQLIAGEMANNAGASGNVKVGKLKYYIKMFFQPYKYMANRYKILNKIPILLPFFWVHRALKTLLFDKEKAETIRSRYDDTDISYGQKLVEFKKNIGL